jgi:predicted RNase H-like nuclease (RuvC/YqgF family)
LSSKKNALDKQTTELTETHEKLDQLKLDLEQKTSQVTTYLIEIKELNQEKNQLSQNVAELEARKAEMSARIHESPQKTDPDRVVESEDTAAQQLSDELASLAKEKDHLENELIKLRTKNQSMNDEKITWLNEKVCLVLIT